MADTFKPPAKVAAAAKQGLKLRRQFGRGGTRVGLARAHQLADREPVSQKTIRRMVAFFDRHEENKDTPPEEGNGRIAWLLWGGDAGRRWAEKVLSKEEERSVTAVLRRMKLLLGLSYD